MSVRRQSTRVMGEELIFVRTYDIFDHVAGEAFPADALRSCGAGKQRWQRTNCN